MKLLRLLFCNIRLFNYAIEISPANKKWNQFKVYDRDYYTHIVWGKLSFVFGQPHLEQIHVCSHCHEEIQGVGGPDECLNWCENCQQLEGDTEYLTIEQLEQKGII